jgi:hypothetical protein
MTAEWMLTDEEIIKLIEQLEEMEPQPSLSKWMAKAQAKKLLEYLKKHSKPYMPGQVILNVDMNEMLKQLEAE